VPRTSMTIGQMTGALGRRGGGVGASMGEATVMEGDAQVQTQHHMRPPAGMGTLGPSDQLCRWDVGAASPAELQEGKSLFSAARSASSGEGTW